MALTQRQAACFEKNTQFLNEVAAALLPIAAAMLKQSMVIKGTQAGDPVAVAFADKVGLIANQILAEQGINLQAPSLIPVTAQAASSTAMKYLVQQMLLRPTWTLTPDQWAADEAGAFAAIQTHMAALLTELTAIPTIPTPEE